MVVCLSSRRTEPFSRRRLIGRCPLATSVGAALAAPQLLQLRCHAGTLLLSRSLRVRLRVLLLFAKVVRLLSHRGWLLQLGRIAPLSPLKTLHRECAHYPPAAGPTQFPLGIGTSTDIWSKGISFRRSPFFTVYDPRKTHPSGLRKPDGFSPTRPRLICQVPVSQMAPNRHIPVL